MTIPRDPTEITIRLEELQADKTEDFFGKRAETLLLALPFTNALVQEVIHDGVTEEQWEATDALIQAREYLEFAVDKIFHQRGLSAARSVDAYREWLWLLVGDEAEMHFVITDWPNDYGLTAITYAAEQLGLTADLDRVKAEYGLV